ncbi:hypothetical protein GUJ93_ZPchr0006g44292 [Zizania palustris]|uniref:Uncharacterized protein n=1 Tax=Zizania palustris TaxID=103762 RepID=A0A8J5VGQ9_ZIZPA|nr:hypothetical protein GUJ93_ZPchr0006g44292 [Zizania palustris]
MSAPVELPLLCMSRADLLLLLPVNPIAASGCGLCYEKRAKQRRKPGAVHSQKIQRAKRCRDAMNKAAKNLLLPASICVPKK